VTEGKCSKLIGRQKEIVILVLNWEIGAILWWFRYRSGDAAVIYHTGFSSKESLLRGSSTEVNSYIDKSVVSLSCTIQLAAVFALLAHANVFADRLPGASGTTIQADDLSDFDIDELVNVRVSAFDVALHLDRGYRASNSVSGSRFDAPIFELPFAIQAFTESFIKDQKARNIYDIARYSPGVTYRSNDFNEGNANLAIRGFPVRATKGNIQILRDGFNGPSIFDFTNISRVEVVKGPSSFLYGQVAPGGIVNVITKKPQSRFAADAELSYGSYDQYRFDGDITGPVSDGLFFRLATSYDQDIRY
jgi:iron complex outermembrane receptor protein